MNKLVIQPECSDPTKPIFEHLEPIVSVLLQGGNQLARGERWGSTKDGFVCFLKAPIDFALVTEKCELPATIVYSQKHDFIGCTLTGAAIYGSK